MHYFTFAATTVALALSITPRAHALPDTLPVNKCLAGKISNAGGSAASRVRCLSKDAKSGATDPVCLQKSIDKLAGKFTKLEAKYSATSATSCITFDDLPQLEQRITDHTEQIVSMTGTAGDCDAGKMAAIAKYVRSVTKCAAKAAAGAASIAPTCPTTAATKLAGALDRSAERGDCSVAGSQAAEGQGAADLFVELAVCLFNRDCPPVIVDAHILDITSTSASLSITADEDGTAFALLRPAALPPPALVDVLFGGATLVAGTPTVVPFTWLAPLTEYIVWVVTRDADGNTQASPRAVPFQTLPPNQPPVFTMGSDLVLDRVAGVDTFPGWLTGLAPGPAFEASQHVTVTVEVIAGASCDGYSDPHACLQQALAYPQIDPATGDLTLDTSQAFAGEGSFDVRVTVTDDGGTDNGGVDTSSGVFHVYVNKHAIADNLFVTGPWGSPCIPVTLSGADPEGDPIAFNIVSLPIHGTIFAPTGCVGSPTTPDAVQTCELCYVPTLPTFVGVDSFTYYAEDGFGGPPDIAVASVFVRDF